MVVSLQSIGRWEVQLPVCTASPFISGSSVLFLRSDDSAEALFSKSCSKREVCSTSLPFRKTATIFCRTLLVMTLSPCDLVIHVTGSFPLPFHVLLPKAPSALGEVCPPSASMHSTRPWGWASYCISWLQLSFPLHWGSPGARPLPQPAWMGGVKHQKLQVGRG